MDSLQRKRLFHLCIRNSDHMEACCQDNASLEKRDRTHGRGTRSSYQRYFCTTHASVHERGWLLFWALLHLPLAACVVRHPIQNRPLPCLSLPCPAVPCRITALLSSWCPCCLLYTTPLIIITIMTCTCNTAVAGQCSCLRVRSATSERSFLTNTHKTGDCQCDSCQCSGCPRKVRLQLKQFS